MNKLISLSLIIISVFLTASCAKEEVIVDQIVSSKLEEVIADQVITSKLEGDNNILYVKTTLSGNNEVPAVVTTATGDAAGTFNKTTKILNLTVNYAGITPTAWHIHKAAAGVNGGVVFNFGTAFSTPFVYTSPVAFTAAQETDLTTGLNYLNLHSAKNPGGEIRGQLEAANTKATGAVIAKYNKETKILTLNITYAGITPTAWHIHKGAAGTEGPVVFALGTAFASPFNYSTIALTAEQETDLLAGLYYVNIHSKIAPGGEIRGQITAKTKASGAVTGNYNKATKILALNIKYDGMTPTSWHIHKGAVGTTGPVVFDLGTSFVSPFNYSTIALTAEQEKDLLAGLYYVNIHSKIAPGGEIRGQIAVN